MSLLKRGTETVTVYPEELVIDADGNKITRAAKVGALIRAVVQLSGTPTENADNGFNTESRYQLRLINYPNILALSHRSNGKASGTPSPATRGFAMGAAVRLTSSTT
ncbi:hypothetical protein [Mycobacterium marinum]|uniref:hypothetical protein n=1 Tax=Mycobacterium marinum TaxID=1781 RepID=UPI002358E08B|nr:hypothetical protein [Mycobacterium marinum]MDC9014893.1 hypothetical protein [Mycobacterium marinum]